MDSVDEETCDRCEHEWDPHVLIPTMQDPMLGGLIFCHIPGCPCQTTWSIDDNPMPYIPDDSEVDRLRLIAQTADELLDPPVE